MTSAPGILSGVAGLITAVVGLIIALDQVGVIGDGSSNGGGATTAVAVTTTATTSPDAWAAEANKICARATDEIDALPEPEALDLQSVGQVGPQMQGIHRRMLRDLTALERPAEKRAEIQEFLRSGARLGEAADQFFAALRIGDLAGAQASASELSRLGKIFDANAIDLGANTCAEGASEIGGF